MTAGKCLDPSVIRLNMKYISFARCNFDANVEHERIISNKERTASKPCFNLAACLDQQRTTQTKKTHQYIKATIKLLKYHHLPRIFEKKCSAWTIELILFMISVFSAMVSSFKPNNKFGQSNSSLGLE